MSRHKIVTRDVIRYFPHAFFTDSITKIPNPIGVTFSSTHNSDDLAIINYAQLQQIGLLEHKLHPRNQLNCSKYDEPYRKIPKPFSSQPANRLAKLSGSFTNPNPYPTDQSNTNTNATQTHRQSHVGSIAAIASHPQHSTPTFSLAAPPREVHPQPLGRKSSVVIMRPVDL